MHGTRGSARLFTGIVTAALLAAGCRRSIPTSEAEEIRIADGSVAVLASVEDGRKVLESSDEFIQALGPLERQILLGTDDPVTHEDYAAFAGKQVLPWKPGEKERLREALRSVEEMIGGLDLPLPPAVQVVKTTGRESWGAAYTRGSAIVLPPDMVDPGLLVHELFHVMTRNTPALERPLYRILGFETGLIVELPGDLDKRKMTNPDAPLVDCAIRLRAGDEDLMAAPVIFSRLKNRDPAVAAVLEEYLEFKLLVIEERGGRWVSRLRDGSPWLIEPSTLPAFAEKVGRNTGYIIHPEEILAENFVHLVRGRKDLPDPWIIDALRKTLAEVRSPSAGPTRR
jgi:hypothetical protein